MWNDQLDIQPLKMRRTRSFETSGTNHPLTQFNVSEERTSTGLPRKPPNKQASNESTKPFAKHITAWSTKSSISLLGQTKICAYELPISLCNSGSRKHWNIFGNCWTLLPSVLSSFFTDSHIIFFAKHRHSGIFSNC